MAEEITVTSDREKPYPRDNRPPGLSPLQAGLLYGGAGAAIGGPIGLLAGLFAGVVAKRGQESYLDRIARNTHNTRREYAGLQDTIDAEMQVADPTEARALSDARRIAADGWYRLESGDESGRAMIEQANETIRGILNADMQAQKAEQAAQFNTQRGLITSAAPALRDQYSGVITNVRQLDSQSERILRLTADPGFDPNKPFNKAILAELVTTSMSGMFRDDPNGLLNGLAELGSGGSEIGTVIATLARAGKAVADTDEFQVSREEYNRIALNIREVARQYGGQRLQELVQQADNLDAWAKQVGAVPTTYNLRDYVSGGIKELQVAPAVSISEIRPTDSKQPPSSQSPQARVQSWQPRSSGPQRRARPQVQEQPLQVLTPQDDWARELLGIPTSRQRRPTN